MRTRHIPNKINDLEKACYKDETSSLSQAQQFICVHKSSLDIAFPHQKSEIFCLTDNGRDHDAFTPVYRLAHTYMYALCHSNSRLAWCTQLPTIGMHFVNQVRDMIR